MTSPQFDVIVVGAGTAGIPVALGGCDAGARVLVVEKRDRIGGMLEVSGAQFSAGGTKRQHERGIADTPELHANEAIRIGHGLGDEELIRISTEAQREAVDWITELGFDFDPTTPSLAPVHELYEIARTYKGTRGGLSLIELYERELARRPGLEVLMNHRLIGLIRDEGSVAGVQVEDAAGVRTAITAKAVVLATGGYCADRELVRRFVPAEGADALVGCLDYALGEGLTAAESAGAAVTNFGSFIPSMSMMPDPERPGFAVDFNAARVMLLPALRQPYEVWLNDRGERFVREDTASADERERALMRQPRLRMAILWDQRIMDTADPIIVPGWTREQIAAESLRDSFVFQAGTVAELARKLDIDEHPAAQSVRAYNQAVADGRDPAFGRHALPLPIEQPPFYGLVHQGAMLASREGLRVDTDLRVLDRQGQPIHGLYAVGEILGTSTLMGDAFVGGMIVGPALGLGRRLGQHLARIVAGAPG